MKSIILFVLFSFCGLTSYSQDQSVVDKAIAQWIINFNSQNYREIYNLYADGYKSKVSLAKQTKMLEEIFGMMGKLKSAKFVSYQEYVYKYVFYAKKNQIEADVSIVFDKNSKLFYYFTFDSIGGTGDPPRAAKGR